MALSKIVEIEDEKVELENTKNEMEKKADRVSSLSARKKCYAEIVSHFPDGWMDSSTLGRHGESPTASMVAALRTDTAQPQSLSPSARRTRLCAASMDTDSTFKHPS